MDEVHFVSKGSKLLVNSHIFPDVSRRQSLSPIGEKIVLIREENFSETYTFSCMCSLSEENSTYIKARVDTNTQIDFLQYITESIQENFLKW